MGIVDQTFPIFKQYYNQAFAVYYNISQTMIHEAWISKLPI